MHVQQAKYSQVEAISHASEQSILQNILTPPVGEWVMIVCLRSEIFVGP